LFFNTNFYKRLYSQEHIKECISQLREFFKYDFVIMPFFSDTTSDKRALIVVLRVSTSSVDLYDRDREEDSK